MNELANLDTYLISKHWGIPKCKEKNMDKKYRNNLLNGQHLENDQDDLGNVITKYDHIYIIHLSKYCGKPEYIHVIEDGLLEALDEFERDNLIDIQYYGRGEKFIQELESRFDE
ncbi:TPA: hypothetical protein QFL15_001919 [Enterococcus faecium]